MGLESVEVILEIEDRFGISIPDEDASRIRTVGDLVDVVHRRIEESARECENTSPQACRSSRAFYRLRRELLRLLPLARHDVQRFASLEELIPRNTRRRTWQALQGAQVRLPQLEFTSAAWMAILVATLVPTVLMAVWLSSTLAVLASPLIFLGARAAADPFRTAVPESCHSVEAAARFLSAHPMVTGQSLSRADVASMVRQVLSTQLRVPAESIQDDRLLEDLAS